MSKRLVGGIIRCKDKTSSSYLIGCFDGSNIGSSVNSIMSGRNPPLDPCGTVELQELKAGTVRPPEVVVMCCVFFPFILNFNGRTSRGHTGRR